MRMKYLAWASAAALFASASAPAASARTLTYSSYGWVGDDITITSPNMISGGAGEIWLTTTSGTVDAWCMDVLSYLQGSGTYNVGPLSAGLPGVPGGLTHAQIGEIGALVENGDSNVNNPGSNSANDVSAATQVAIWEVEYGSAFSYHPISSAVTSLAAIYYTDATTTGHWAPYFGFSALSNPGNGTLGANQTLITVGVPEPSTWAMLLLGFAGLAFGGYRRAKNCGAAFTVA